MKNTREVVVNIQREIRYADGTYGKALGWPQSLRRQQTDPKYKWHLHTLSGMPQAHRKQTQTCSLYQALTHTFGTPAYFVAYKPTKAMVRVNNDVFDHPDALHHIGGFIEIHLAIFDLDKHMPQSWVPVAATPEEKAARLVEWSAHAEAWFAETLDKITKLQEAMPGLIAWRSQNGYRLLALLETPIRIHNHDERKKYTHAYSAWVRYLARAWGITTADKETADNLGDTGRYMRVPRHVNYPTLPIYGDVEKIGYWRPNLSEADYPTVKVRTEKTNKSSAKVIGGALLHQLIVNRGTRCEHVGGEIYSIECPDVSRHSGAKDYVSKTLLYVNQGSLGAIKCMSDGCVYRQADSLLWLEFFSDEEVIQAEQDLGRIAQCGAPKEVPDLYGRGLSPRVIELIALGRPENIQTFVWEHSRNHEKDEAKTDGQWVHECICALKTQGFTNEEMAGILVDPRWGVSSMVRSNEHPLRYALLLIKNAEEAVATGPTREQYLEFYKWFQRQDKWKKLTDPQAWQEWNSGTK